MKNRLFSSKQPTEPKKRARPLRHHPFVVPVLTFLVLFIFTLIAFVNFNATTIGPADARVVNLFVDGRSQTLPTRARTVEDLLQRLDISVGDGDVVEPKISTEILSDNFTVNVYRARPITIVDGETKIIAMSAAQSPRGIVNDSGIKLHPEDLVQAEVPDDVIKEGTVTEKLVVSRSIPVKLVLFGTPYDIRTRANTVSELMSDKQINEQDVTVFPDRNTKLKENSVVFVTSPGKKIITTEEDIPAGEETVDDPALESGQTKIKEKGQIGKKVVIYEVDKNNTKKKKVLQTIIATKPIKRVIAHGTKTPEPTAIALTGSKAEWMRAAGIDPSQYQYADYIIGRESGWNPASVSANRCIGLGQKCDASSLISACPNWQSDPVCQLRHFSGYANGRYGSWQGAYGAWQAQGWW